jgi:hypothetical protein
VGDVVFVQPVVNLLEEFVSVAVVNVTINGLQRLLELFDDGKVQLEKTEIFIFSERLG